MTCTTPDPTRLVREYGCVLCQKWHDEFSPLYAAHLFRQSKHGWRDRRPTPNEVLKRIRTE